MAIDIIKKSAFRPAPSIVRKVRNNNYKTQEATVPLLFIIALIVVLIIVGPLLTIWGLNTLFPVLAIPYTWKTWLATIFVVGAIKTTVNTKK